MVLPPEEAWPQVQIANASIALKGNLILIHLVTMLAKISSVVPREISIVINQSLNVSAVLVNSSKHVMEELWSSIPVVHDMKGSLPKEKKKAGVDGSLLVCNLVKDFLETWCMKMMLLK